MQYNILCAKGIFIKYFGGEKSEEVTKKSACDGSCRKYDDDKYFSDESQC